MFDYRGPETAVWIGLSLNSCVHLQWTGNGVRRILNFAVYRNGDLSRVLGLLGILLVAVIVDGTSLTNF
ncbi:hypothetical protein EYC84_002465 [Monilinia fructicola]|uniref:Uncharacterized protein n=1 Tax=Monilinia fructicola TaxID=38448 RepID=A0A5M9JKX8_MONFR|nr:hypothetical protein EYC84_002465 [Monilinia fructicola]